MFMVHSRASAIICASLSLAVLALSPAALAQKTYQFDGGGMLIPVGAPVLTSGPAAPYPSTVAVSGLTAPIGEVKVRLNGFSHTYVDDLDVLLVGPGGQTCLLNRVGGGNPGVSDADYLFADDGATIPPVPTVGSGRYRPSQRPTTTFFPAPAPASPYGTSLAGFRGQDANGVWSLYIQDNAGGDVGEMDGWTLLITEAPSSVVNTGPIAIPAAGTLGPGNPYPSTAIVDGLGGGAPCSPCR